jgi:hypothetical protein
MARKERKDELKSTSTSVLPMQLQVGDRFTDERGEWEIVGRPVRDGRRQDRPRPGAEGR